MIASFLRDLLNDKTFDYLPMAIIDANSNILETNDSFKQHIDRNKRSKFRDLFKRIWVVNNIVYAERDGRTWRITYKKYGAKYKVWCVLDFTDAPSVWSTIPSSMVLINNDGIVKYLNKAASTHFTRMRAGDRISTYYPTLMDQALNNGNLYDLVYDGKLSKIQVFRHNDDLWLLILKNSLDVLMMEQEQKEANHLKAMGQVTTSVIHDFRNILSAIIGYCDLVLESKDVQTIKNYVTSLLATANNATAMVKELLRFAKSNSADKNLTSPSEVLNSLTKIIDKITGTAIKVVYDIKDTMGKVSLSQCDLERIILNVVMNAKDAIKAYGTITISLYKRYFDEPWSTNGCYLRKGFYLVLRISDTGSGIHYEDQDKVFTPFFTTKKNGNGLGLSTILSMLKDNGAGINVLSTPFKGTCILIYMPIMQGGFTEEATTTEVKKENIPIKATIVLVEDNPDVSKVCKIALEKDGYEVLSFNSAEEAIQTLQSIQLDLLITDANLPGISGAELVSQCIHNIPRLLVISGYDKSILADSFPEETEFLPKPISLFQFREKVYKMLVDE